MARNSRPGRAGGNRRLASLAAAFVISRGGFISTPIPTLSGTLAAGQSQPVRMFAKMPTYTGTNASLGVAISPNAKVLARYTDTSRTVSEVVLGVPADNSNYDSTFAAEYTRVMEAFTGRPQLLAGHAVGSTTIAQWQPGQQYHTELLGVISAMPVGFDRAIFFLGGSDAGAGTSAAAFKAGLAGYFDSLAAYNKPSGMPFQKIVIAMGTRLAAGDGTTAQVQEIRKAAKEYCAANNGIYLEPHDLVLEDAVHQSQAGNITLARTIARAAVAGADNGPTLAATGTLTGTVIKLRSSAPLTLVGDVKNRFSVFNAGTSTNAVAIASVSVSGMDITITLSADPGTAQAFDVYWLRHPDPSGTTAAANMLYDTFTADGLQTGRHLVATTSGPVSVPAPGGTSTPTPTPSSTLTDTFTAADGTAVSSRAADTGQAWTSLGVDWNIQSNRAFPSAANAELTSGYAPASADYFMSQQYNFLSVLANQAVYLEGRYNGAAGASNAYFFGYRPASGGWIIGKSVGGTFSVLVSAAYTAAAGDVKVVRAEMSGSTLRLLVDGVQVLTTTDTSITAVGKVAIRATVGSTATTGIHIDNLNAGPLT